MKNPTGQLRVSGGDTSSPWKKSRTPPVTGHCACKKDGKSSQRALPEGKGSDLISSTLTCIFLR